MYATSFLKYNYFSISQYFCNTLIVSTFNEVHFLNPRLGMRRIVLNQFALFKEKSTVIHIPEAVFTGEPNAKLKSHSGHRFDGERLNTCLKRSIIKSEVLIVSRFRTVPNSPAMLVC